MKTYRQKIIEIDDKAFVKSQKILDAFEDANEPFVRQYWETEKALSEGWKSGRAGLSEGESTEALDRTYRDGEAAAHLVHMEQIKVAVDEERVALAKLEAETQAEISRIQ